MAGIHDVTSPARLCKRQHGTDDKLMQVATATGVTAGQNGTLGENKVPHEGKELTIWARIATEVIIRDPSESGHQISTVMASLNLFRQHSQGDLDCSECVEITAIGPLLSTGAVSQAPPTERDDRCAEAETRRDACQENLRWRGGQNNPSSVF